MTPKVGQALSPANADEAPTEPPNPAPTPIPDAPNALPAPTNPRLPSLPNPDPHTDVHVPIAVPQCRWYTPPTLTLGG